MSLNAIKHVLIAFYSVVLCYEGQQVFESGSYLHKIQFRIPTPRAKPGGNIHSCLPLPTLIGKYM